MKFEKYIKGKKHTLKSISDACGIPYSTLHKNIENPTIIKGVNLKKLSEFLEISMDELWDLLNSDNTSLLNVLLEQKRRKRDIYLKPILYLMVKKVVILMTLLKQPIIFTYLM